MEKKIVCPECGKPLAYDEVLETWGAGRKTMTVVFLSTCPHCGGDFTWEMTYQLDKVGEVEPV